MFRLTNEIHYVQLQSTFHDWNRPKLIHTNPPKNESDCNFFSLPQIVVPKKRTAILLDRLMVALKKAIEEEANGQNGADATGKTNTYSLRPEDAVRAVSY